MLSHSYFILIIITASLRLTVFLFYFSLRLQLAARPGTPESLQELVEIAKGTPSTNKDDKGRLSKEKKVWLLSAVT